MSNRAFAAAAFTIALAIVAASRLIPNDYFFSAAYTVLQFIILATAWNILGGYTGYVNFGSAAFFALGAYSSVAMHKLAAGIDNYFPESLTGFASAVLPLRP